MKTTLMSLTCAAMAAGLTAFANDSGTLTGELKQWHKVTLTLDGPLARERDTQPNAFTDLAFNVTFTHESGAPI